MKNTYSNTEQSLTNNHWTRTPPLNTNFMTPLKKRIHGTSILNSHTNEKSYELPPDSLEQTKTPKLHTIRSDLLPIQKSSSTLSTSIHKNSTQKQKREAILSLSRHYGSHASSSTAQTSLREILNSMNFDDVSNSDFKKTTPIKFNQNEINGSSSLLEASAKTHKVHSSQQLDSNVIRMLNSPSTKTQRVIKLSRRVERPQTACTQNNKSSLHPTHLDAILEKVRENVGDIAKSDEYFTKEPNKKSPFYQNKEKYLKCLIRTTPKEIHNHSQPVFRRTDSPRGDNPNVTAEEMETYSTCKLIDFNDSMEKMTDELEEYAHNFYWKMIDMTSFNMDIKKQTYNAAKKNIRLDLDRKNGETYKLTVQRRFANSVKNCTNKLKRMQITVDQVNYSCCYCIA